MCLYAQHLTQLLYPQEYKVLHYQAENRIVLPESQVQQ